MQTINTSRKSITTKISIIVVGFFSGFASASMGIGGGAIIIPAFTILLKTEIRKTIPISLSTIIFSAITATISHFLINPNNIKFTFVLFISAGTILGAKIGSKLISKLNNKFLFFIMGILFFIIGIKFLNIIQLSKYYDFNQYSLLLLFPLGLSIGFISSIFGIGGGIITVPILNFLYNFPISQAIATSVTIIIPTTLAGIFFHSKFQKIDFSILKLIIPSTIISSIFGSIFSTNSNPLILKYLLGIFMIITSIKMIHNSIIINKL